ncbi:DUF2934 domain-containing protein [Sphingobium sp.]|uniref:DUF2934 domain-containing protein n=1 Tax=Sphingobium sp. TaxID=1912891 RepID=UPI002B9FE7AC|nr:DUF2934 domain-containing protein [Sphingobium sp.]HUD93368.1 DUF2934 domain-containing protein [Sphingobium sp.]
MSQDTQEKIRARAHAIWEAQGHPDGRAEDHWRQAESEIAAQAQSSDQNGEAPLPNPLATGAAAGKLAHSARRDKSA